MNNRKLRSKDYIRKLIFLCIVINTYICSLVDQKVLEIENYLRISDDNFAKAINYYRKKYLLNENKSLRFLSSEEEIKLNNEKNILASFKVDELKCSQRPHNNFSEVFGFFPTLAGKIYKEGEVLTYSNDCFKNNQITIKTLSEKDSQIKIEIKSSDKTSFLCKHAFFFATTNVFKIKVIILSGLHNITLKNLSKDDFDEIKINGIKVFEFCHGFLETIFDILKTKNMFEADTSNGDYLTFRSPSKNTENINKEFLEEYGFEFFPRKNNLIHIDKSLIKDGDVLTSYALDAGHTLIMFATGGRVGHCAILMWEDEELYVYEASDRVRKLKYDNWISLRVQNKEFMAYHPLSEEFRQKFNKTKALEFYNTIDEHPYGMKNFIFSWFDVTEGNVPSTFPEEVFPIYLSILEKFKPAATFNLATEALLNRLEIYDKNMTIPQITAEAARRGKTIEQLMSMPELEVYNYNNGPQYICSTLVAKLWKEGGLFDRLEIRQHEFTPKDIYELNFFETDINKIPKVCTEEHPDLPYCMIYGKYQIYLPSYNSILPYKNMNEKCPSSAPHYLRPKNC